MHWTQALGLNETVDQIPKTHSKCRYWQCWERKIVVLRPLDFEMESQ